MISLKHNENISYRKKPTSPKTDFFAKFHFILTPLPKPETFRFFLFFQFDFILFVPAQYWSNLNFSVSEAILWQKISVAKNVQKKKYKLLMLLFYCFHNNNSSGGGSNSKGWAGKQANDINGSQEKKKYNE